MGSEGGGGLGGGWLVGSGSASDSEFEDVSQSVVSVGGSMTTSSSDPRRLLQLQAIRPTAPPRRTRPVRPRRMAPNQSNGSLVATFKIWATPHCQNLQMSVSMVRRTGHLSGGRRPQGISLMGQGWSIPVSTASLWQSME